MRWMDMEGGGELNCNRGNFGNWGLGDLWGKWGGGFGYGEEFRKRGP